MGIHRVVVEGILEEDSLVGAGSLVVGGNLEEEDSPVEEGIRVVAVDSLVEEGSPVEEGSLVVEDNPEEGNLVEEGIRVVEEVATL